MNKVKPLKIYEIGKTIKKINAKQLYSLLFFQKKFKTKYGSVVKYHTLNPKFSHYKTPNGKIISLTNFNKYTYLWQTCKKTGHDMLVNLPKENWLEYLTVENNIKK